MAAGPAAVAAAEEEEEVAAAPSEEGAEPEGAGTVAASFEHSR
jgi:hypothetical protein